MFACLHTTKYALMVSAVSQPESQPASHLVNQSAFNISHGLIICIHVII